MSGVVQGVVKWRCLKSQIFPVKKELYPRCLTFHLPFYRLNWHPRNLSCNLQHQPHHRTCATRRLHIHKQHPLNFSARQHQDRWEYQPVLFWGWFFNRGIFLFAFFELFDVFYFICIFFELFDKVFFVILCFSKEPYASFNTQTPSPITFADVFDGFLMTRVHKDPQASVLSRSRVSRENKLVGFFCLVNYWIIFYHCQEGELFVYNNSFF